MTTTPPRRSGRPRKSEIGDTRAALLSAALQLFVAHGYSATSVRMIARAAGLSDGGLYAHFANKRAVYDELLATAGPGAVDELVRRMWPDPPSVPPDPAGFLGELIERILEFFDTAEARMFSTLLLREEIPTDPSIVTGMLGKGAATLGPLFIAWGERELLSETVTVRMRQGELTGEELAWELLSPLVLIRLVYLTGKADQPAEGRRRAGRHLEFFLGSVVRPPTPGRA